MKLPDYFRLKQFPNPLPGLFYRNTSVQTNTKYSGAVRNTAPKMETHSELKKCDDYIQEQGVNLCMQSIMVRIYSATIKKLKYPSSGSWISGWCFFMLTVFAEFS